MRASKEKKEHYKMKIKHLADEFFAIPKEDNSLASKRNTLKEKLWVALWLYYKNVQYARLKNNNEVIAEKYSGTINSTIAKAMETYKIEKETPFLHYVNAAVEKEISREKQKNDLHGLKIPQKIFRQWKQLKQLAHSRGIDSSDINKMRELGSILCDSENELEQVLDLGKVKITSDTITRDGKERSMFDVLESDIGNPEKEFEKKDKMETALYRFRIIDEIFKKKQERVKKYLSALLTLEFFLNIVTLNKIIGRKHKFAFVDLELYAELDSLESKGFSFPAQQDIAARFGRDKTDASRTLRTFLQEVRQKVSTVG